MDGTMRMASVVSKEMSNYIKIALLLLQIAPRAVRIQFDKEFHPEMLPETLKSAYGKLLELRKKNRINQMQWNLLFPIKGNPISTNFDISIMVLLLRHLADIAVGDCMPFPTDVSPAADLFRIKHYRNKIAHLDSQVFSEKEFDEAWKEINMAIHRLGGYGFMEECDVLKTAEFDATKEYENLQFINTKNRLTLMEDTMSQLMQNISLLEMERCIPTDVDKKYVEEYVQWIQDAKTFHPTSAAASITDIFLSRRSEFVVITGRPGSGKTALARYIAVTLYREEDRLIVSINNPSDFYKFFRRIKGSRKEYVLVIDDLLGRQTIRKTEVQSWIQLYIDRLNNVSLVKPFRIIATCRLKISESPEFASLRYVSCLTECNISADFQSSMSEMRQIALCHLDTQSVELLFQKNIHKNENFYTLCYLSSRLIEQIDLEFFYNAFSTIEDQINDMYTNNKICFLHLALLTIFDGRLSKHRFEENDEIIWEALNFLREECNLNSVQYENILQGTLPLVGRYLKDNVSDYVIIHPELFDLLVVYFFNKIPKSMLKYGSDNFLQIQIQLASIVTPLIPGIIMIEKCLEDVYFNRIIHDIENEQYKNAFDNIQIANEIYQQKLISYLSKSLEVLELVLSDFKKLLFSVQNGSSNLVNFIIVECRNRNFMSEYSRYVFHFIYEKRVTLKLYPHVEEESLLLLASLKGHISVIKVLLSLGFDKDHQDEFHRTPLQMACIQGHSDVVKLLLQCGCDINLCHGHGGTAFHEACLSGSTETVEIFMQILKTETEDSLKPDYSMRDFSNKTPLFLACSEGHLGIVKLFATLVNTTSSPIPNPFDFTVTDRNEWNMLHVTCQYGHIGIVTILLEQNFAVNETDTDGWTPLFYACDNGRTEIIKLLLKKDLNVNIQDNKGLTSLHVACKNCHPEIVMLLVEYQCNLNIKDRTGKSPLHLAVEGNSMDIVNILVQSNRDLVISDRQQQIQILYKRNAIESCDINAQDNKGCTALHIACLNGYVECAKMLLKYTFDINKLDKENKTPLIYACEKQDECIVDLLLNCNADVNISNNRGKSPLHIAVERENTKLLKTILQCKNCQVDAMYEDDYFGLRSALHLAIDSAHAPIVKILLDSKCDVNIRGPKSQTPFMYAFASVFGASDIRKLFMNTNCDVNIPDIDGKTPLHIACEEIDIQLIKMILRKCQDINATDNFGRNALHYASECVNTNTVNLLIKEKCNINQCDENNETPIFFAVRNNHGKSNIQALVRNHCDINIANNEGVTLLHIACRNNDSWLVNTLIKNECNVQIVDKEGRTALHIASAYSSEHIFACLVKLSDVNVKNKEGETSLHIACRRWNSEIVNLILQHSCDVNTQDKSGTTALHIAAKGRQHSIMEMILRANCDVNNQDEIGQTALLYAVGKCFIDIVKILLNYNCDVTIQNKDGKNALQLAEEEGYTDIVNMLSLYHS